MPTYTVKEYESGLQRMLKTGNYDPELAKRLDNLYREWGLDEISRILPSQRKTVTVKR